MSVEQLPPFPVDTETLTVVRDSLNRLVVGLDDDGNHIYSEDSSLFSLSDVLNMLSGYDESKLKQALNEYDQPIPDVYDYDGCIYHINDVVGALITEIMRLRGEGYA